MELEKLKICLPNKKVNSDSVQSEKNDKKVNNYFIFISHISYFG
jgi:hypothetical protein